MGFTTKNKFMIPIKRRQHRCMHDTVPPKLNQRLATTTRQAGMLHYPPKNAENSCHAIAPINKKKENNKSRDPKRATCQKDMSILTEITLIYTRSLSFVIIALGPTLPVHPSHTTPPISHDKLPSSRSLIQQALSRDDHVIWRGILFFIYFTKSKKKNKLERERDTHITRELSSFPPRPTNGKGRESVKEK